jgi:hypothetical protein
VGSDSDCGRDQGDTQANAGDRIFGQRIEVSQDAVEFQSKRKALAMSHDGGTKVEGVYS